MAERRRRGHGEGSIYQLPTGRWQGSIDLGWKNGKRQRRRVNRSTRREVADALHELERNRGEEASRNAASPRLTDWMTTYFDEVASERVRPRTLQSYRDQFARHVEPALGDILLDELMPKHFAQLYRSKKDELAASSIRRLHAVLRRSLTIAVRWELIRRNPVDLVDPPPAQRKTLTPYSAREASVFLRAASPERLFVRWVIAVTLGLRQGEALGLQWSDLDDGSRQLHVQRSLQRHPDGRLVLAPVKTESSDRVVPVTSSLADLLRSRRDGQAAEREVAGPLWTETDLVLTTHTGGPIHPRNDYRTFRSIVDRAGLRRTRLHDLRHTTATIMLEAGVPARVVMELLGHSQIAVTMNTYTHVDTSLTQIAVDRVQDALDAAPADIGPLDGPLPGADHD